MANLEKQLKEWTSKGLLSEEQSANILKHESSKTRSSWLLYGVLVLGVSVTVLGIISLIAANWKDLSDSVKLGGAYMLMAAASLVTFRAFQLKKPMVQELGILSLMLLSLATIGLISQVFHMGGKFYEAMFLWGGITLPAMLLSSYAVVPFVWFGGFLGGTLHWLFDSDIYRVVFHKTDVSVLVLLPLMSSLLAIISRMSPVSEGIKRSLKWWVLVNGSIGIYLVEMTQKGYNRSPFDLASLYPAYLLSILLLALLWGNRFFATIQKIILSLLLASYTISFHFHLFEERHPAYYAVMTILDLGLLALFFGAQKSRRWFNLMLILIGSRFFFLFIEAIGGLASTGTGLVLSGIVLISLASIWHKRRNAIADWAERIAQ